MAAAGAAADARLKIFGIRHHGPGSARSLLGALNACDPAIVLIEGPPDANDMIRFAGSTAMTPPVALLVHGQNDPANASFFPFGLYSPEWQAMRWAVTKERPVRFIDLPAANRLAALGEPAKPSDAPAEDTPESAAPEPTEQVAAIPVEPVPADHQTDEDDERAVIRRDPLGFLATIAGYDDSEAWWNALIEQGANAPTVFDAIETAMTELRDHVDARPQTTASAWLADRQRVEQQREAHMRLAIAAALKETEGVVAVVCGAWHVPALRRKASATADRAILKGLPSIKVTATWVPWTDTRLAVSSGYGAGVVSPAWYAHVWQEWERQGDGGDFSTRRFTSRWLSQAAKLLRDSGRETSTASVIDAVRLAESLAALRDMALPGLDEMRSAGLSALCLGETAPWRLIETELVIGSAVGAIDDSVPQMPLQADLTRLQKKVKLKPEALDREASLDLRSSAGLEKSLLLHRLNLINVPWGTLADAGSSRGTFRENWRLRWDPEFSVRLAEALVYGTTVEQASGNASIAAAKASSSDLGKVSAIVKGCLLAGLSDAARVTIGILQGAVAATSDIAALAAAIPPLVTILRYGTAREMPADELRLLVTSLAEAVCSGLVYGCRNLQADEAGHLRSVLSDLDQGLQLLDDEHLVGDWHRALMRLSDDAESHALLRGLASRKLHDHGVHEPPATADHFSRALSRAVPAADAGYWLDGFLAGAGQVLLHDETLLGMIDGWIAGLDGENFIALLPMLRRAFASLDHAERRRLLDAVRQPAAVPLTGNGNPGSVVPAFEQSMPGYEAALPLLLAILGIETERQP